MRKINCYSNILKKGTYSVFFINNINSNFSLDFYKKDLNKLEKDFINERSDILIENLKLGIDDNQCLDKKKSTEILNLYTDVINNNNKDFNYICNKLKEIKFSFADNDTEYSGKHEYLMIRSILFSELKKNINFENYEIYIKSFKELKKEKIIGNYTYGNLEEYIFKTILNKIKLEDIKEKKILEKYYDKFMHNSLFESYLGNLFSYVFKQETDNLKNINQDSKKKLLEFIDFFPGYSEIQYKKTVKILFYYLSEDIYVTYNEKGYFLLPYDINYDDKFKFTEINNIEDLKNYKTEIHTLNVNVIIDDENNKKLKSIENFFEYNKKVEPIKKYHDYFNQIKSEYKKVLDGNFNISFKLKVNIHDGKYSGLMGNMVQYYIKNKNIYNELNKMYNNLKNVKININKDKSNEVSTYGNILYYIETKITSNEERDAFEKDIENSKSSVNDRIENFKKNIVSIKQKIKDLEKTNNVLDQKVDLSKYSDNFFDNLLEKDFNGTKNLIDNLENQIKSSFKQLKENLKSTIKNINDINSKIGEIDGKDYKLTIDTSKYTDEHIDALTVDNILNEKVEIMKLFKEVQEANSNYQKELNKKLEEEKAKADKEEKDKIDAAEKKEKEIKGEIEKVCNDYLTSIKNSTITENFDKNIITTDLDNKINECYTSKGYNVNDLTGWKTVNDKLLATIQQLKSDCISKCNDEIDKKLKEIADKKQKELEEQQRLAKEEADKKDKEEQQKKDKEEEEKKAKEEQDKLNNNEEKQDIQNEQQKEVKTKTGKNCSEKCSKNNKK